MPLNIPDFYDYLVRARRDLWATLEALPEEKLSEAVLPGERFHSINDLVLHIPAVEDSWLHEDILRDTPVWDLVPEVAGAADGPHQAHRPLADLLTYWRAVETSTLAQLPRLVPEELGRRVVVSGARGEQRFTVEGLLWHVLQHEVRHTAQIAVLLRQAGVKPPPLDLIRYLPPA